MSGVDAAGRGAADWTMTAVIVTYDAEQDLRTCLDALALTAIRQVVLADNSPTDATVQAALAHPAVLSGQLTVNVQADPTNPGFAVAANRGMGAARTETVLLLNPDVLLSPDCPALLLEQLRARDALLGPVLRIGASGQKQVGAIVNHLGMPYEPRTAPSRGIVYVPGCAVALRRSTWLRLGGMDERLFLLGEDLDLGWRARVAGLPVEILEAAHAYHAGGGSLPGGYTAGDGRRAVHTTSRLRVGLRERNCLAVATTYVPAVWLPWLLVAGTIRLIGLAVAAALLGRGALGRDLLVAWLWNVRQLPATRQRRRSSVAGLGLIAAARVRSNAARPVTCRPYLLLLVLRTGLPTWHATAPVSAEPPQLVP